VRGKHAGDDVVLARLAELGGAKLGRGDKLAARRRARGAAARERVGEALARLLDLGGREVYTLRVANARVDPLEDVAAAAACEVEERLGAAGKPVGGGRRAAGERRRRRRAAARVSGGAARARTSRSGAA
jgi:hypothetical protein